MISTKLNFESLKTATSLDKIIRKESDSLFDLDIKKMKILFILGRDGPLNEKNLGKECNIKKDSVRQMIRGRTSKKVINEKIIVRKNDSESLTNQGYVTQSLSNLFSKVITKTKEYEHVLTVKGLLVSFIGDSRIWPELNFEDHYLIREIRNVILQLSDGNDDLADTSILFMKYDVALFLHWHRINDLNLSIIDDMYAYFENWNSTNSLLNPESFYPTTNNTKQHDLLMDLRNDFFAVSCVLDAILKEEKKNNLILQYIRKWVRLAETLRDNTHDQSIPRPSSLRPGPIEAEFVNNEKIMNNVEKVLDDSGINNLKLPIKIPSIFQ